MSLTWKVMDQTMPKIIHVSRCTFDAVSTRILQEIYYQRTDVVFFSVTNFYKKGASPCAGKYSCTGSKKNVLKAFFVISRFIENKPVNWQLCIKGKQKRYFERSFKNYMNPCAYLSKWSPYAPGQVKQNLFLAKLKCNNQHLNCPQLSFFTDTSVKCSLSNNLFYKFKLVLLWYESKIEMFYSHLFLSSACRAGCNGD